MVMLSINASALRIIRLGEIEEIPCGDGYREGKQNAGRDREMMPMKYVMTR
jgi:hypothetical protein